MANPGRPSYGLRVALPARIDLAVMEAVRQRAGRGLRTANAEIQALLAEALETGIKVRPPRAGDPLPGQAGRVATTLRLPARFLESLRCRAERDGRSLNAQVEALLREMLDRQGETKP